MQVVHLDYAEIEKKKEGVASTKSFLVGIDRNTRYAFAKVCKGNARAVISFLPQKGFEGVKRVVSDKVKVFESKELREWARKRNIEIWPGSPYHPQSNGLAEGLIRDLKMFMSMYPDFAGGWKCSLEAAVKHHNRSFCSSLGCSPHYALKDEVPSLQADRILGIEDKIKLVKQRDEQTEKRSKAQQKRHFDKRHSQRFPKLEVGQQILVRVGLSPQNTKYKGPFVVKRDENFNGVPKRIFYDMEGKENVAT